MEIYVNGALALIKKNSSFEYVSENRLFSGSDDYTLNITFPLRGCASNIEIFGTATRKDFAIEHTVFDCEIRDRSFYKAGCIVITGINETEITAQFLEGRSEQNYDMTFDDIYINELDLGTYPDLTTSNITPAEAWKGRNGGKVQDAVCLPWWNDSETYLNNCVTYDGGSWKWLTDENADYPIFDGKLSWLPYLYEITCRICEQVGYSYDLSAWHEQERNLVICNVLPAAWEINEYAAALPSWTVTEFFEKLELFLKCEFEIDHRTKSIKMQYSRDVLDGIADVELTEILDEYTAEVTMEQPDVEYIDAVNLCYSDRDDDLWKIQCCDWSQHSKGEYSYTWSNFRSSFQNARRILVGNEATYSAALQHSFKITDILQDGSSLAIALDQYGSEVEEYMAGEDDQRERVYTLWQPRTLNSFGARIVDESPEAQEKEIEFIPARIDTLDAKRGSALFMSPGSFTEVNEETDEVTFATKVMRELKAGEQERGEYYDKIFVGYWGIQWNSTLGLFPHPEVEEVEFYTDANGNWQYRTTGCSLRINSLDNYDNIKYRIDAYKKYTFQFIADSIPNVRALFFIHGKKYVCEKITATFTEHGMSQLLKGEFYRVVD